MPCGLKDNCKRVFPRRATSVNMDAELNTDYLAWKQWPMLILHGYPSMLKGVSDVDAADGDLIVFVP